MGKQKTGFPWMAVFTLGLSVLVKLAIVLWGWARADFDPEAPVPYRVFVATILVEAAAIMYLLAKVLWIGTPALLK